MRLRPGADVGPRRGPACSAPSRATASSGDTIAPVTLSHGVPDGPAQRGLTHGGQGLPAASPIASTCRRAASLPRPALPSDAEVTPGGVRVRLPSPGHVRQALQILHALGYQAAGEPGGEVIVTGWDAALLAARAVRLEIEASSGARDPAGWASAAIARFRELQAAGQAEEPAVVALVACEARLTALEQCLPHHLVPAPAGDGDGQRARRRVRDLLDHIARGQAAAADTLASHAERISEAAARLFLAERDVRGQDEETAAATAARKAAEMHGPPPGGSPSVLDPATGKVRVLDWLCGTCVTRKDNPLGADGETVIQRNLNADALLTCHSTLPWGPYPGTAPAVCAGFWARHAGAVTPGRLALVLGITRVPAPGPEPGPSGRSPDLSPEA